MPGRCVNRRRIDPSIAFPGLVLVMALSAGCGTPPPRAPNAAHEAASTLNQQGARALQRGDAEAALALYSRALALADSVEDFDLGGATLLNLALVHSQLGQAAAAQQSVDRILAAPQLYPAALQARAAARKALLALDGPDHDAALRWADTAQRGCAEPCELSAAMADLRAHVALERGDVESAARLADGAAGLALAAGQEAEQANALRLAGRAHSRAGRTENAATLLAQALVIDRRLGLSERIGLDLIAAADNEARRAQPELSRAYLERALSVYLAAGNRAAAQGLRARIAAAR